MEARILVLHRPDETPGGDLTAAKSFADALDRKGCDVVLRPALPGFDPSEFDIVHLFAVVNVSYSFPVAGVMRRHTTPFVVTPLYYPRDERLKHFGNQIDVYPGYLETVRYSLMVADRLACFTMGELRSVRELLGNNGKSGFVMGTGFNKPECDEDFELDEVGPYVISIGRIEPHKNQVSLAQACIALGIKLFLVGEVVHKEYAHALQGNEMVVMFGNLPHGATMNLLKGAVCHALPSFGEIVSQANQEAAYFGIPQVIGLGHDWECFGDRAEYCDPTSWIDIMAAVERSLGKKVDPWTEQPTWDDVAKKYLDGVEDLLPC